MANVDVWLRGLERHATTWGWVHLIGGAKTPTVPRAGDQAVTLPT